MEPIDLKAPRVVVIQDRGHSYTYTLNPITSQQWKDYFKGIVHTAETIDKENVNTYDNSDASVELVRSAVVSVKGYEGMEGSDLPANWKSLLPPIHLLSVAGVLRSVSREDNTKAMSIGREEVRLSAVWGVTDDGKGMFKRSGLVHYFNTPSIEHQRRYSRESSRSVVVGGSRTAKTVWRGYQLTLIAIYDELVTAVDGYTINGTTEPSADDIRASMDSFHKVAAAEGLFIIAAADEQEATGK